MRLDNKISVVTGASSGIGRQTAIDLANLGSSVVLIGRSEEKLRGVEREIKKAKKPAAKKAPAKKTAAKKKAK